MTYAQKVSNALRVFIRDGYADPIHLYEILRRYTMVEIDSFDTQYYFGSFYIGFTYYRNEFNTMSLYTDRYNAECPLVCFERTGDIIIGRALDKINIYNGCPPTAQDFEYVGLEYAAYQYLFEIQQLVKPMLENIASTYLK